MESHGYRKWIHKVSCCSRIESKTFHYYRSGIYSVCDSEPTKLIISNLFPFVGRGRLELGKLNFLPSEELILGKKIAF